MIPFGIPKRAIISISADRQIRPAAPPVHLVDVKVRAPLSMGSATGVVAQAEHGNGVCAVEWPELTKSDYAANRRIAYLNRLQVVPEAQRHGWGGFLLDQWLRAAKSAGAEVAYLIAAPDDHGYFKTDKLVAFYGRHGFVVTNTMTPDDYAVAMRREL